MDRTEFGMVVYDVMIQEYDDLLIENVEHEFSQKFEKKIEKLIKRRRKPYFRMINTVGKRVACIALAIFIASATTVMSVDALRNAVFNFFISVFSTHSDISAIDDDRHPDTIEDIYEITYDLSNYKVDYESYSDKKRIISYIKNNNEIVFMQYVNDIFNMRANTEDAVITHININGYDVMYFFNNLGYHNLIWDNGKYMIVISSNLPKEEVVAIAESVRKVENK